MLHERRLAISQIHVICVETEVSPSRHGDPVSADDPQNLLCFVSPYHCVEVKYVSAVQPTPKLEGNTALHKVMMPRFGFVQRFCSKNCKTTKKEIFFTVHPSLPTILRLQPRGLGQKMISSWWIKHDKVCSDAVPIDYFSTAVTQTWNCRVNRNTNKRFTTFSSIKVLLVFMFAHQWACMKRKLISSTERGKISRFKTGKFILKSSIVGQSTARPI